MLPLGIKKKATDPTLSFSANVSEKKKRARTGMYC